MKVSENIAIGNIPKVEELPIIKDAAHKSLADTVVDNLPEKYHQMLGKRFAEGVELSGGQWQKVALARAYMKDAQLLTHNALATDFCRILQSVTVCMSKKNYKNSAIHAIQRL